MAGVSHGAMWQDRMGVWHRTNSPQSLSLSLLHPANDLRATLEGRSPVDGRMITMEMR